MSYYKLPLDIGRFFSGEEGQLEQCSELESVDQYLALILLSRPGEHSFDTEFGTKLWEMDFENISSKNDWKTKFTELALEAIKKYEKRLKDIDIQVDIKDVVREDTVMQGFSVRKQVDVIVLGTLVSTNKQHGFKHVLYLGPLSGN